jgi:hypothetical protein
MPEMQKRRTLQALVDQLAGLAGHQPVLALYEDVHWIDPSTLELLSLVIERILRLPVLALITFRPEFQPPWTGQAHVTPLVARVTGDKPLPGEIVEQIVARTDGVPLFVEELTKTVLESGLLADLGDHYELSGPLPPLAIPATLHDSLNGPPRPSGAKLKVDSDTAVGSLSPCTLMIAQQFEFNSNAAIELRADLDACPVPITTAYASGPGTLIE